MSKRELTAEAHKWLGTGTPPNGRCPACGVKILEKEEEGSWWDVIGFDSLTPNFRILKGDGAENTSYWSGELQLWARLPFLDDDEQIQCKKCGGQWYIFTGQWPTAEITETHMTTRPIGTEVKKITNRSALESEQKVVFTQEWTKTLSISYEQAKKVGGEVSGKTPIGPALKLNIEKQLKSNYAISESLKQTATYENTVKVPPRSKLKVSIHWKKLFQHGVIKFREQNGNEVEMPYAVAVRLTQDLELE